MAVIQISLQALAFFILAFRKEVACITHGVACITLKRHIVEAKIKHFKEEYMLKKGSIFLTVVLLAVLITSLPLISSCATKSEVSGGSLKIGAMTPSTGPVPEKGLPGQHGIYDAVEYINKELGGAGGHPIELIWRDTGYDMSRVVTITKDFTNAGALIFITHSSTEMNAAAGVSNPVGFPGLAAFISTINLHPPKSVYGPTPDYGDDWVAFAKYYMQNIWKGPGKPKMALHLLANPTGIGSLHGAKAMADSLGIELLPEEQHKISTTSEIESLTRIKSKNPDVLFISSTPAPTAVIIRDAKQLGMLPKMTVGTASASFTQSLIDLGGADTMEGVYGVYHTVSWEDKVPGVAKATDYVKKNNPSDYGNTDYFSTWATTLIAREILDKAVKNAGYDILAKGDEAAWKAVEEQGIKKLSGYKVEGIQGGTVSYTPGDNRLNKYLRLYKITGGNIVPVTDWQEAPLIKYEELSWWGK